MEIPDPQYLETHDGAYIAYQAVGEGPIDIHEDEEVDADAFQALIRAAIELNTGGKAGAGRAR